MKAPSMLGFDEEAVSLLSRVSLFSRREDAFDEKIQQTSRGYRAAGKDVFLFLLPSFLLPRTQQEPAQEKLRPTAYLDGLRGVAAWTVLNAHLSAVLSKGGGAGWGYDETHREFYKLPIFRLLYNGNFAVALFFVISGFALSISFISTMRQSPRDPEVAFQKLASSVFRRPMRLFLPSFASMLVVFILVRLNFFASLQARQTEFEQVVTGWPVLGDWPARHSSFFSQFADMLSVDGDMLKVFTQSTDDCFKLSYNPVLWTIKLEFRSSLVLFLTHIGLYFVQRPARLGLTAILIFLGVAVSSFDLPHFWAGYAIAECSDFLAPVERGRPLRTMLSVVALISGLFLGSFASWQPQNTPWCAWLIPLTPFGFQPVDRFWTGLGAVLTLSSFGGLPWLVRLFNSRLIQYLGKISFALYLVHFWMVQACGTWVYYQVWSLTGQNSAVATIVGFFIGYAIVLGSTIWVADIFWRAVDVPLVNVASRLQKRLFVET